MGSLRGLRSGRPAVSPGSILAVALLAGSCLTGCRSGSSGMSPSWSMFGGSPKDGGKLAAAPAFEGDATKPSANAKPYPTTSTPEGYVLDGAAGRGAPGPDVAPAAADAIVYGSSPPASAATPDSAVPGGYRMPATTGPASVAGADTPMSSIVPQVGPYAASTPATPATIETASAPPPYDAAPPAAAPAFAAETPGAVPGGPASTAAGPPARVADARGAAGWGTDAPAAPASFGAADRYAGESRYGGGSRFAGGAATPAWQPSATAAPAAAPSGPPAGDTTQQPDAWPASSAPTAPFGAPAVSAPPAAAPAPFGAPPAAAPGPSAVPGGPVRRPDPGYRPGGTSSYRRAGDDDEAVVPASFEAGTPQR